MISDHVEVTYHETHVGHKDEARSQRLTYEEKQAICDKLQAGIPDRRIIKDARIVRDNKFTRMNLLNRNDVRYLKRKYVDKRRHVDETVAITMKVEEWNAGGKNNAFLYKAVGEQFYFHLM